MNIAQRGDGVDEHFSEEERRGVYRAIYERRDVRAHFLTDPVPDEVLCWILDAAHHAPSVGFMQPWDFLVIRDLSIRPSGASQFRGRQPAARRRLMRESSGNFTTT